MAVAPLFISTMAALKSACRLSGSSQADSQAIIDAAVLRVRSGIYGALGESRTNAVLLLAHVDAPTTPDQLSRVRAEQAEILWTKALLLNDLPVTFVDSGGAVRETWNEDAITRNPGDSDRAALIERYMDEVRALLDLVAVPSDSPSNVSVSVFGAPCPIYSGASIGAPS